LVFGNESLDKSLMPYEKKDFLKLYSLTSES
jgi:hypothetical protein